MRRPYGICGDTEVPACPGATHRLASTGAGLAHRVRAVAGAGRRGCGVGRRSRLLIVARNGAVGLDAEDLQGRECEGRAKA
jgi:hypothetical protein